MKVIPVTPATTKRAHYSLKQSPHGSHHRLLALLPQAGEGRRVLDLGAGTGELSLLLANRGFEVTAVEQYPFAFDAAGSLTFHQADLEQGLPPLKGAFDWIILGDVLEHLREPAALLGRLPSLLTPGGVIVASLPNSGHWYFRLNILFGRFPQDDKGLFDRTHLHFFMWRDWCALFQASGFRPELAALTVTPLELRFPRSAGSLWLRCCVAIDRMLASLRKELFAYQFIVLARPARREP